MSAYELRNAAMYLRTLASVEQLRLVSNNLTGDEVLEELTRLTDYVDLIECMSLAALLDVEASLRSAGVPSTPPADHFRKPDRLHSVRV